MERTLKIKEVSYGIVELRSTGYDYRLYLNGDLICSTSDLSFILSKFDSYC